MEEITKINWEQKALDAINAIAEGLGQGAEHFYPILVRQHVIDGLSTLFFGTIPVIISLVLVVYFIKVKNKFTIEKEGRSDASPRACFGMLTLIPATLLMFIASIVFSHNEMFTKIFNPEYHALKDILELMK